MHIICNVPSETDDPERGRRGWKWHSDIDIRWRGCMRHTQNLRTTVLVNACEKPTHLSAWNFTPRFTVCLKLYRCSLSHVALTDNSRRSGDSASVLFTIKLPRHFKTAHRRRHAVLLKRLCIKPKAGRSACKVLDLKPENEVMKRTGIQWFHCSSEKGESKHSWSVTSRIAAGARSDAAETYLKIF